MFEKSHPLVRAFALSSSVVALALVACSSSDSSSDTGAGASSSGVVPPPNGSSSGLVGSSGGGTLPDGGAARHVGVIHEGMATFYSADGSGNCSFPASSDHMVVAPNKERWYEGSGACGACFEVKGTKGSVVVRVVDSCPIDTPENDCGDTGADLDSSAEAFATIEDPKVGITKVTFQVVPCQVTGPMQYQFKSGSSEYWTAIQVRNHREPIAKVEYEKDGSWIDMPRSDDDFFTDENGVGPHPEGLPIRITSVYAQVVEETLPIDDKKLLTGTQQFD